MTSVVNSARVSTASVFDFVGTTANVANSLVSTAARSVDMLDAKAQLMHARVTMNSRAQLGKVKQEETTRAALEHAKFLADVDKQLSDKETAKYFASALKEIEAAMTEE